ncbi:MAG: FIVAR domain-containing protein [Clostridiales bacterium]|nr:FIVAR domain-containing protein [Candidatus Cacconaster stercorequi]
MMKRLLLLVVLTALLLTLVVAPAGASTRVDEYISNMSVEEKVTQMLMMDFRVWNGDGAGTEDFTVMNDDVREIIEQYNFGAVIYFANNIKITEDTFHLTQAMQEAATRNGGIPMLIATDQEGGSVYRLGSGTALPGNMALGATGNEDYAYEAGRIIGNELSCLGINAALAPVVDVNNNANNPVIGLRAYSDDAQIVGNMASKCIEGMAEYQTIGCAKHFPGHGDTGTDSHYDLPVVDKPLDVLMDNELLPYQIAISQGVEMIMTAHILYPQLESDTIHSDKTGKEEKLPATMSDDILTGLLKEDLSFDGIICTDAMNMSGISDNWDEVQAVKNAIQAGADLICMPTHVECKADLSKLDAIIDGVVAAVNSGEIDESRLDDACRRILTVKENHGILDYDADAYSLDEALSVVGCEENRAMERQMAADAVTVIQNNDNTLPLKLTESSKVLMLTPYNNECGQLAMGWNRAKEAGLIPDGAEIRIVRFNSAELFAYQTDIDWADTLLINSEISSASTIRDNDWDYAGPRAFLEYAVQNDKTVVVISVDKPYDVQVYPEADAVLAVYGCKGSSVDPTEALIGGRTESEDACGPNITAGVEVAFGVFGAYGKLPINIPVLDRETYTYGDEILYQRGYGLTYDAAIPDTTDKSELENTIAEAKDLDEAAYTSDTWRALTEALERANSVYDDPDADQESVDAAVQELLDAMDGLMQRVNMDALRAMVRKAETIDTDCYTDKSVAALSEALDTARTVLQNPDASRSEVSAAYDALQAAVDALEKVSSASVDPVDDDDDAQKTDKGTEKKAGGDVSSVPTGDTTPIALYASMSVIVLIGVVYMIAYKKGKR